MNQPAADQPLGPPLPDWRPAARPARAPLAGARVRLEPLDETHADALWRHIGADASLWAYMPGGPFADPAALRAWVLAGAASSDPLFFAIVDPAAGEALGVAAYLRIDPANGCIEIGHLTFGPRLQRTPAATEALSLLLDHAFALGYRRVEWKCNHLNAPSRRAAQRLGFAFEGIFRQAAVVKGRNRDTAWYAILDGEWPALRAAHQAWLAPANFDAGGRQIRSLRELTAPLLAAVG